MAEFPSMPPENTDPWYLPLSATFQGVKDYIDAADTLINDELGENPSGPEGTVALRLGRMDSQIDALQGGTPPDPPPPPPATPTPELPFNLLSTAELRASTKKVFAHYMPMFSTSVDNKARPSDATEWWYSKWFTPAVEGSVDHRPYGGYMRQYPLAGGDIRPEASCSTSFTTTASWQAPTDGWQVKKMEEEVRQAISRGLDGFVLLVQHPRASVPGALDPRQAFGPYWMMKAAGNVDPGFKCVIAPCTSVSAINGLTATQLADEVAALAAFPAAYRLPDGRLLIAPYDSNHTRITPSYWNAFAAALLANHSINVAIMPNTNTVDPAVNNKTTIPNLHGYGEWGDAFPAANVPGSMSAGQPHALAIAAKAATGGALAWLQDIFAQYYRPSAATGQNSVVYENEGTKNMRQAWQIAREDAATFGDIVQLTTWNDYFESTMIAPTAQNGWLFLDLHAYFLQWYKTDTPPTVVRDAVYLVHRKHPKSGMTFTYTQQTQFAPSTNIIDQIEVVSFLTAPATVSVYVGVNRVGVFNMAAGMNTVTVPMGAVAGDVGVVAVRSNTVVASVKSKTGIVTTTDRQDFCNYGASSLRDPAFDLTAQTPPGGWTTPDYVTTIGPTADTYVHEGVATTNFGSDVSLAVNGESGTVQIISLVRFDVPANPQDQVITGASLALRTADTANSHSAVTHDVRLWDNTWDVSTVTWNTRPTTAGALVGTIPVTTTQDEAFTVALSAAALAPLAGQTVTLALVNNSNTSDPLYLKSNDYGTAGHRPKLTLTYSTGVIDSTPPAAPTGVSASVAGTTINLGWSSAVDNVGIANYRVHRSASAGFTPSGTTAGSGTCIATPSALTYADTGRPAGAWYYKIIAVDTAGNVSAASSEVSATVAAAPTVQTVTVDVDTFVNQGEPTTVKGSATSLASLRNATPLEANMLMRFTLPAAPGGQTLTSAVLRFRTDSTAGATTVNTHRIALCATDTWDPAVVNWNHASRPAAGATLGTITAAGASDTVYTAALNVSTLAPKAGTTFSIMVLPDAASGVVDSLWIWSKDYAAGVAAPQLELTYS
jgi:hypothetical protein